MVAEIFWLAGMAGYVLVAYGLWRLWSRPRLLVLREEAQRTRYRVPRGLVAVYLLAAVLAPLTGLVVAVGWGIEQVNRLRGKLEWLS